MPANCLRVFMLTAGAARKIDPALRTLSDAEVEAILLGLYALANLSIDELFGRENRRTTGQNGELTKH